MYSEVIKTIMSQMHILPRKLLPPMVSQKYAGAYNIYPATKAALENSKMSVDQRICSAGSGFLIYRKHTTVLDPSTMLDNDNRECKRVPNAIVEALQYSDSIDHFSMVYTTSRSTQNYIEVTIANADLLTFFP